MSYYGIGKGFRVNGVLVGCGICVHKNEPCDRNPCHDCWMAIHHGGDIEDIVFEPENKEHFFSLQKLVHKYRDIFDGLRSDAEEYGVSVREITAQFTEPSEVDVVMMIK